MHLYKKQRLRDFRKKSRIWCSKEWLKKEGSVKRTEAMRSLLIKLREMKKTQCIFLKIRLDSFLVFHLLLAIL